MPLDWDSIKNAWNTMFGSNAPQMAQPQPTQTPSPTATPLAGAGAGSGIGGTTQPATGNTSAYLPGLGNVSGLPSSMNVPGMGQISLPQQGFFDQPGVQGLLSAGFGALSAPRGTGRLGILGRAGAAGLGAYDTARANQFAPYKTLAELQRSGAETELAAARGEEVRTQTQQAKSIGGTNKLTGDAMRGRADQLEAQGDSTGAGIWRKAADAVGSNTKQIVPLKDAFALGDQLAQEERTRAQAAEVRERQKVDVGREKVLGGELGVQLSTIDANRARASAANASADALRSGKVMSENDMQVLSERAGKDHVAGMKRATNAVGWPTETEQQFEQRKQQEQQAYSQTFLNGLRTSVQQQQQQRQGLAKSTAAASMTPDPGTSAATSDTGGGASEDEISDRY